MSTNIPRRGSQVVNQMRDMLYQRVGARLERGSSNDVIGLTMGDVLSDGQTLSLVSNMIIRLAQELHVSFGSVGGRSELSSAMAHVISAQTGSRWFASTPAGLFGSIADGQPVLLVDATSSGGLMLEVAADAVEQAGGRPQLAVVLLDLVEPGVTLDRMAARQIDYEPLLYSADFGL